MLYFQPKGTTGYQKSRDWWINILCPGQERMTVHEHSSDIGKLFSHTMYCKCTDLLYLANIAS